MSTSLRPSLIIVLQLVFASSAAMAQQEVPASAPPQSEDANCDAICKLGRALNEKNSPIQSQSGIGRGIVTKEPTEQRKDYRPPGSSINSNTRIER